MRLSHSRVKTTDAAISSSVDGPPHDSARTTLAINPLHAELNPICHLLALLGAHLIFHVSSIRVNINKTVNKLDVHESVHRDTIMKVTNKMQLYSSSSSSVGATARCGLWPVEQYLSICPYLSPTLSIFSLPALEDLFLLLLSILSWAFPFVSSFPFLE